MSKSIVNSNSLTGEQLYQYVKAGFMLRGTSLTAWCQANKVNPTNARAALIGSWRGPKAKSLCDRLRRASRVDSFRHIAA